MFKVFVVGDTIKVVRRFSLPNISNCEKAKVDGVFQFPRVSSAAASADNADLDPSVAELPPKPFLEALAKELRILLVYKLAASSHFFCQSSLFCFKLLMLCFEQGLRLFNIDMIREHGSKNVFYVIDINYFPGLYLKLFCTQCEYDFVRQMNLQSLKLHLQVMQRCQIMSKYLQISSTIWRKPNRRRDIGGDWLDCTVKNLLQNLYCKCIGCSCTFTKVYFSAEIFAVVMITVAVNYWLYFCKIKHDWIKCVVAVKKNFSVNLKI